MSPTHTNATGWTSSDLRDVFAPIEAGEPSPATEGLHWRREQVIPLRKDDLVRALASGPSFPAESRGAFQLWCRLLEATIHHQCHRQLNQLKSLYAPFDPDATAVATATTTPAEREQLAPRLFEQFAELLRRANYRQLDRQEIELATKAASDWGLRLQVDFRAFERLEVFACGDVLGKRRRRTWRSAYREEEVLVPLYQRLVVIVRMRRHKWLDKQVDTNAVYLKMFKNIPKQDVDMLLPCTRFRMSLLDRGKILLPTASGVALAALKIIKGAVVLAMAGVYGILVLIGGTVGYGVKSFIGYQRTKDRYHLNLTRNLYYQNLDNNAGVLFRVLDEAEEQEFREAALAYALLHGGAGERGWLTAELDRAAEEFLNGLLGFRVDFEVRDALNKLVRFGCVEPAQDGRWRAIPPERAAARLDRAWDDDFRTGPP